MRSLHPITEVGGRSIDPVLMLRMLIIAYRKDAAFGAATAVEPKFISPSRPTRCAG
jgi:hypothetical protein